MIVYPYSYRHVWTHREGATLKDNDYNEIYSGCSRDPWTRPQSTMPIESEHVVGSRNEPLLTHQNCVLNTERSASYSSALTIGKVIGSWSETFRFTRKYLKMSLVTGSSQWFMNTKLYGRFNYILAIQKRIRIPFSWLHLTLSLLPLDRFNNLWSEHFLFSFVFEKNRIFQRKS